MPLDETQIEQLLDDLLLTAKKNRERIPYSKVDGFTQCLVMIGPNSELATLPVTWSDGREKYAKMRAVSEAAKETFCQAVILISDTRWVENERAEKVLGLPPLKEIGLEKWKEEYKRIVNERFNGYLGNAPRELYSEAIVVVMKGPRLNGIHLRMASYEEGPNDSIHWLPPRTGDYKTQHFNLLPDWWV